MCGMYGEDCMDRSNVSRWCAFFKAAILRRMFTTWRHCYSSENAPHMFLWTSLGLYPVARESFPSLHLRHSSFSNISVALPTSHLILQYFRASPMLQLILQYLFRFSYVTGSSFTSPGEPPMPQQEIDPTGDRTRARSVKGNDITLTPQRLS